MKGMLDFNVEEGLVWERQRCNHQQGAKAGTLPSQGLSVFELPTLEKGLPLQFILFGDALIHSPRDGFQIQSR